MTRSTVVTDDAVLISRAREGDREALSALVRKYEDRVYRLVLRIVRHPQNAEDVLQETFINIIKNLCSFNSDSAFATWVYRIATNQALMHLRKNKRIQDRTEDIEMIEELPAMPTIGSDWSENPAISLLRSEIAGELDKSIAELPEKLRVVFLLRDVEGLPAADVGEILQLSIPAVKSRLHRARLMLRESLGRYFNGRDDAPAATEEGQR